MYVVVAFSILPLHKKHVIVMNPFLCVVNKNLYNKEIMFGCLRYLRQIKQI